MGIIGKISDWIYSKKRDWKALRGRKRFRKRTNLPEKIENIIKSDIKRGIEISLAVNHARLYCKSMGYSDREFNMAFVDAVNKLHKDEIITAEEYHDLMG
ncbi:hypothetical protein KY304_02660 [Candidatus Woesearchaeota archaeon]|nr:hypothetical protein [Candidatus Woesearchaeota archaeon]